MKNLGLGLLFLRVSFGGMMLFGHGLGKLSNFSNIAQQFPAIFGMSSTLSLGLAVFAEFFCALFIMLGLFTRVSSVMNLVTMLVAAFVVHASDGFGGMEKALLFAAGFLAIILLGPGPYSIDAKKNVRW